MLIIEFFLLAQGQFQGILRKIEEIAYLCRMSIPVLVVDNHDSFVYNLVQMLREDGRLCLTLASNDALPFSRLGEFRGVLLSPGPGVPSEAGRLMDLVGRVWQTHSILGVCLGHQALATYFGGRLRQLVVPHHGERAEPLLVARSRLWQGMGAEEWVGRYHSWTVERSVLPSGFVVTLEDRDGEVLAMEHRELPLFGLQFHPESYMSTCGKRLISNWIDMLV